MNVAIIIVAGSVKQNSCFWPHYNSMSAGYDHDLIVVHRNMKFVPEVNNPVGLVIYENKIFSSGELPYRAFGAYRHYWNKFKEDYDIFAFISDDVLIKSNGWLKKAVDTLMMHEKLGWAGTQIFNSLLGQYPHESHCRAPIWFGKSNALKDIRWEFNSDHEGELRIADQFLEAGYFGVQVGNKMNIAYDSLENGGAFEGDHVSSILAKKLGYDLRRPTNDIQDKNINQELINKLKSGNDSMIIESPFVHIGKRKVISQIQPFHGLIYDKSEHLVPTNLLEKHPLGITTLASALDI